MCVRRFTRRFPIGDFSQFNAWTDGTFSANKITLISNGTSAGNKEPRILYTIEQLTEGADSVAIQTPYIICSKPMYRTLTRIAKDSDVSIYINAVARGSNPWGCTDYLNNKKKVLGTGAVVYEVMNEYAIHTKAVLIDDNLSVIGSYNLDMRSTYLDTELMLVIDSPELNAHIRSTLANYAEKSIFVSPDGTESVGAAYIDRTLSRKKKILYGILRVVTIPFRHLL